MERIVLVNDGHHWTEAPELKYLKTRTSLREIENDESFSPVK